MIMSAKKIREVALREQYGYTSIEDEDPFVGRLWGGCEESHVTLEANEYYTPDGNAMVICHGDEYHKLQDMETKFELEVSSTVSVLPDLGTIFDWAKSITTLEASWSSILNRASTSSSSKINF